MDESSRHETREREDRERSPRSPTHHGDATAAHASASPESEHPKESVMETSPVAGETLTTSMPRTRFVHASGKSTNSLEILVKDGSREPTK